MWTFSSFLLLFLLQYVNCDYYMQTPRGSNNRLDGLGRERTTNNRLFDSQNNNRAGYNVGGPNDRKLRYFEIYNKYKSVKVSGIRAKKEEEEAPPGKMKYYEGSIMYTSWTSQHECGKTNSKCEVVLQYMCHDDLRDGFEDKRIPENVKDCDKGEDGKLESCDHDRRYGMHENREYYALCKNTQRNAGLFEADQDLARRKTAQYTRQNDNGNRNGYECPEERDYYPYWRPTQWIDIAVLTYDLSRCKLYQTESENVKPREYCKIPQELTDKLIRENRNDYRIPITKGECEKFEYKGTKGKWVKDARPKHPAPECLLAPPNRDNHHGNGANGFLTSYNWTIPNIPHKHCVLRGRYNITTSETEWDTDQSPALTPQMKASNAKNLRCKGEESNGCCTEDTPCAEGEGDCDNDDQCGEGLVCGKDNSPWDSSTDICVRDLTGIRIPYSGPYVSSRRNCYRGCGKKGGLCEKVCGKNGYCCRNGRKDCDERLAAVAPRYHACVRDQPKLECVYSNKKAVGGSQTEVSDEKLTENECFEECLEAKKDDDTINGCSMYQNGNNAGCFAQHNVQSLADSDTYKTCILTPKQEEKLTCKFVLGDGIGGKGKRVSSSLKGEACVAECLKRKKAEPEINGVTVLQENKGGCWCEYEMTSVEYDAKYKTCLLLPEGVDTPPAPPRCRGENEGCCTKDKPCDFGEGDCDEDYECKGALVCGFNNCDQRLDNDDDCCTSNILEPKVGGDPVELKKRGYKFQEDPTIRPLKLVHKGKDIGSLLELDIALNTAQTGRTFEDRSHEFSILKRPSELAGKKIYNMEVDGKRGNIVQVYPNKEYDYAPNRLNLQQGDMLHMQWTGSERNPRNNDGNGRDGYDRSNLVLMKEESWVEGTPGKAVPLNEKNGHWGVNYPTTLNAKDKTLMGLNREDLQKLALSDDVPLIDESELLSKRQLLKGTSSQIKDGVKVVMQCPDGRVIRVVSAIYGGCSSDAKTCSKELDKCTGFRTQEWLKEDCDGLPDCDVSVDKDDDEIFNLFCDALGHLSVTYKCIKGKEEPEHTCDKWVSGKGKGKTYRIGGGLREDECKKRCWEAKYVEDYRRINGVAVRSNNHDRECLCVLEMTDVDSRSSKYKTCTLKKKGATKKWRDDGKCGSRNRLPSGQPAECDPSSATPCCSRKGVCGGDNDECHCSTCINYLKGFKGDVDEVEMDKKFKEPKKKPTIVTSVAKSPLNVDLYRCRGQDSGCCTEETPCDLYEGDCDNDQQCKGNLICVDNNCPWDDNDDCCAKPSYHDLDASSHYFNLGPRSMDTVGEFKYMCTRNNDFSNRSHKGKVKVEATTKDEKVEENRNSHPASVALIKAESRIKDLLTEIKDLEKALE